MEIQIQFPRTRKRGEREEEKETERGSLRRVNKGRQVLAGRLKRKQRDWLARCASLASHHSLPSKGCRSTTKTTATTTATTTRQLLVPTCDLRVRRKLTIEVPTTPTRKSAARLPDTRSQRRAPLTCALARRQLVVADAVGEVAEVCRQMQWPESLLPAASWPADQFSGKPNRRRKRATNCQRPTKGRVLAIDDGH